MNALAAAVLMAVLASPAAAATHFIAASGSTLVLNGSSNVANWRCTGSTMRAEADVAVPIAKINEVIDRIEDGNVGVWMANKSAGQFPAPAFALSIPIATLRCSGGRPMERDMTHALKADRFTSIEFRFDEARGVIEHDLDQHLYRVDVGGRLSLAGITRELTVAVTAERLSTTRFRLRAELPVRMTDFSITPPTALFGMIKANDGLVVRVDVILEAAP
jgi:hypothetical protein